MRELKPGDPDALTGQLVVLTRPLPFLLRGLPSRGDQLLPFQPGQSGFASVFVGFYPVALVVWLSAMVWLEIMIARSRSIPAISFVEQPPTYAQAFEVQRFQSALSAFTVVWNYLAVVTFIFWLMFYVR